MRRLTPNQTADPARGSFLIRPRCIRDGADGHRIFVAPTEPKRNEKGTPTDEFETFGNAIQFKPVRKR